MFLRDYVIIYEDGVCILRIEKVLPEDEGEYACEAVSGVGVARTQCFLSVNRQSYHDLLTRSALTDQ